MGATTEIAKLRMATVQPPAERKSSNWDTNTLMVRCHREQYRALVAGGRRHADQIRQWHDSHTELMRLKEGEKSDE